jgi:nucleoside-diphosphate-sugar epimerase
MSYHGRRVLVTGGLGFIGLNLTRALLGVGAEVRILNRSCDSLAQTWLEKIADGRSVEVFQGEIADPQRVQECLRGVDVVFNLAAESGAVKSLQQSWTDMQVNIAGHLNLLETVRQYPLGENKFPRIVFVSSRLVYGVTGSTPVSEEFPTRPTSLYGLHKLTAEHYYRLYHLHYGIPFVALRLTNPYGPFQLPHRQAYGIVNRFLMNAVQGGALTVYGEAQQLRDYIHIDDVVSALLLAGNDERAVGEIFNVGSGVSIPLKEMAEAIVRAAGSGSVVEVPWPQEFKMVETGDFLCDISHLRNSLHWNPLVKLDVGLRQTVNSYRDLLQ